MTETQAYLEYVEDTMMEYLSEYPEMWMWWRDERKIPNRIRVRNAEEEYNAWLRKCEEYERSIDTSYNPYAY